MKQLRFALLLAALCLLAGNPTGAWAQPAGKVVGSAPIEITSSRMEADGNLRRVKFIGQVIARQGEMTIHAEELVVHYESQGGRISTVEALRQVRIVKGDRIATGGRAVYDVAKAQVVLTGSPRVQQGANSIAGQEITFFLDSERSIVKGDSGSRVKAIFHSQEQP